MTDNIMQLASKVQAEYADGLAYKKQQGYLDDWAQYERFRSGDQWPKATDRTKDLPRPVFNVIDQIQGHKVSSVMNENIKMVFSATETGPQTDATGQQIEDPEVQAADLFTRYADTTWERIKQDDLNEEALDSASNVGTCIWHYYWDNSKKGGSKLKWMGEMCGEIIDPVNFFPGNPQNRDTQKQPYIIITHRDEVKNIREEAKANGIGQELIAMITPDKETQDQAYDKAKYEITSSQKATVLTKYWRENDGYVYFMKVCGNVVVKPKTNTQRKLYPLEVMQWKRRKKSIFGVGDTEGLIPNQKSINLLIAMQIKTVQDTGWPRMLLKKKYIQQRPTNTPGEILIDNSPDGTWGAQFMPPGTMTPAAQGLVDSILQYTKEVSGANESAMGEQVSAQLNAAAISLLQKQSGIPIESIRRRFYQSMENIARIWEEFFKVNYNTTRMVTLKDENQDPYTTQFNGSQYQDTQMELKIDIGPATGYSETMVMNTLDKFYDKGDIDISMYLKYVPSNVAPFKERMLKDIQENQANAPQQPQDIPNLSISYKDLPLTGQMQVAQKAGIELQPEDFGPQLQAQQQPQGPTGSQQHPFDQLLAQLPQNEQQNFKKMSPEQQKAIVDQMMAHMQQGQQIPPGMAGQPNMMQQG